MIWLFVMVATGLVYDWGSENLIHFGDSARFTAVSIIVLSFIMGVRSVNAGKR